MEQKKRSSYDQAGYDPKGHLTHEKPSCRVVAFVRSQKRLFLLVGVAACLCVFVACAGLLVRYFADIASSRSASSQLNALYSAAQPDDAPDPAAEITATPAPTAAPASAPAAAAATKRPATPTPTPGVLELWPTAYPDNPKLRVSSVFDELQAQNRDIVAWLKIDGVLEEPIVQRDNTYYLTRNALRQESVTGALFLDESCELPYVPSQMVIHGHNMKEGAMFGALKKYKVKGAAFYKEHAYIDFNTLYENGRYVIFSVLEVDVRDGQPHYLPFWRYSRFASVADFTAYVSKARSYSIYQCTVDVQPGDRLLTLSTCTGTDDNARLLVMARKVRPDEDMFALELAVLSTRNK